MPGSISSSFISSGVQLADGCINRNALFANKVIEGSKIADGTIAEINIGGGAVTTGKIGAAQVTGSKLAVGCIAASNLFAAGVVNAAAILDGAIVAGKIAAGGISSSSQFAVGVVDDAAIGTEEVGTGELKAGAVTAGKIGAGAVAGVALADGAAHAEKIGEFEIYGPRGNNGSLNDDQITTIFPNKEQNFLFLKLNATDNGHALVVFETDGSGFVYGIDLGSQVEVATTSDSVPVYTDYTDGKWTIIVNLSTNKIHFCNRTGLSYDYAYTFLNGLEL